MKDVLEHLHPTLREVYLRGRTTNEMPVSYQPDRYFAGAVAAGFLLRNNRLQPDKAKPLSDVYFRAPQTGDTYRRLLFTMISSSLDAYYDPWQSVSDLPVRHCRQYESTCVQADLFFGQAVRALRMAAERPKTAFSGVRLITKQDRPLLLQKIEGDRNSRTALSLQPIMLEGITYPPGSIMGVHVRDDRKESGRYEPYVSFGEVQRVDASRIDGVDFLRPSLFMGTLPEREQRIGDRFSTGRCEPEYAEAAAIIASVPMQEVVDLAEALT